MPPNGVFPSGQQNALVPVEEPQDDLDRYLNRVGNMEQFNDSDDGQQFIQRLSPSQLQLKFLLDTDDVPKKSKIANLWALKTRHLQLLDVPQVQNLDKYAREIRDILRVSGWQRSMKGVSYSDSRQLEFYAGMILLPKSLKRGERTLLATQIARTESVDVGDKPPRPSGGIKSTLRSLFTGD